ncbi:MAG: hypothetical protein HY422_02065 [Candidatus Komeilibacteria bacterium]|nr:hypothetical protein [Candidatus Komeilibacteria bacterium]
MQQVVCRVKRFVGINTPQYQGLAIAFEQPDGSPGYMREQLPGKVHAGDDGQSRIVFDGDPNNGGKVLEIYIS